MDPSSGASSVSLYATLDGEDWFLTVDPGDVGVKERWWESPKAEATPTRVPWIIQEAHPGYRGAAWYWRCFPTPPPPFPGARCILRFWEVDYLCDAWVNGVLVGSHEGAQDMFELDVTDVITWGGSNRLALRVFLPPRDAADSTAYGQTPHGSLGDYGVGGILGSVELAIQPLVRINDLFVRPDPATGTILASVSVLNAGIVPVEARLETAAAPASAGGTHAVSRLTRVFPPGQTLVESDLRIERPRPWQLNDPFLYRVTALVTAAGSIVRDETSVRCGFRDFRFELGFFRLNGRRVFLRSTHTGADTPVGIQVPSDPDMLRRDLLNAKVMGFNMIRFISRMPDRRQLDLCDEIGLMVYEEHYASWQLQDSPRMPERYDRSLTAMIRRDRSHPSVVAWGLLNETADGPVFRHAASRLPLVRSLDDSRLVFLGSGRFDSRGNFMNGLEIWRSGSLPEPNLIHNPKPYAICYVPLWESGSVALNPGSHGEYSAVRWTAVMEGCYQFTAEFRGTGTFTTTDVHVLLGRERIGAGFININGRGDECELSGTVTVRAGESLFFIVGWGGGNDYGGWVGCRWVDNTAIAVRVESAHGAVDDLALDFAPGRNPNGPWVFGWLPAGPSPDASVFTPYDAFAREEEACRGGLSNPGSSVWEDALCDQHYYPRVPHRELEIARLRTIAGNDHPLFLSEYGIGSGVNLVRLLRHYERVGAGDCAGAKEMRDRLSAFTADWERWKLDDTFAGPEDFLQQCISRMAGLRALGVNALRSNPRIVGYGLTACHDPLGYGEGLTTAFRELKPGTVDALFEAFAPLRLCLFVEPPNLYRGSEVRLEAVLANEDALPPGSYPVRLRVVGPDGERALDREFTFTVPGQGQGPEPPFAVPIFSNTIAINGPAGRYRFLAVFGRGGPATGGEAAFNVMDPADMPPVRAEVVTWGEDSEMSRWLAGNDIRTRPFSPGRPVARETILVCAEAHSGGGAEQWRELAMRVAAGSTVLFLCHDVFRRGDDPLGWLPLAGKGTVSLTSEYAFPQVYPKDEWAKRHPIFHGMPCGGLMDHSFYREIIPDYRFSGQETPIEAVAGSFRTSCGRSHLAELMVSVHSLGAGRFILNSLRIRQALGRDPVAEMILRNMLNYASIWSTEPPAALPPDFDAHLRRLGYAER